MTSRTAKSWARLDAWHDATDRRRRVAEKREELAEHRKRLQERWPSLSGLDERGTIDNWNRDRSSFVIALNGWLEWTKGVWRPFLNGDGDRDRDLITMGRMSIAKAEGTK